MAEPQLPDTDVTTAADIFGILRRRKWTILLPSVSQALGMLPKEKVLGIVLNRQADADVTKYYY